MRSFSKIDRSAPVPRCANLSFSLISALFSVKNTTWLKWLAMTRGQNVKSRSIWGNRLKVMFGGQLLFVPKYHKKGSGSITFVKIILLKIIFFITLGPGRSSVGGPRLDCRSNTWNMTKLCGSAFFSKKMHKLRQTSIRYALKKNYGIKVYIWWMG